MKPIEPFEPTEVFFRNIEKAQKQIDENPDTVFYDVNFDVPEEEFSQIVQLGCAALFAFNLADFSENEEFFIVADFALLTKKMIEKISNFDETTIHLAFSISKREMVALQYVLSKGLKIFSERIGIYSGNKKFSNDEADKSILIESFRRRILVAAGISDSTQNSQNQ